MYEKAYALLGENPKAMQDTTGALAVIRKGLYLSSVNTATETLGIHQKLFIPLIGGSVRSFQRKKDTDRLTPQQTEHTLAILNILAEAEDYFGDRESALTWIKTNKVAFANQSPLDYCDTMSGIDYVLDEINKLKHGMTA